MFDVNQKVIIGSEMVIFIWRGLTNHPIAAMSPHDVVPLGSEHWPHCRFR